MSGTVWTERALNFSAHLFTGVDVLEDHFFKARKMFVPLFEEIVEPVGSVEHLAL